MRQQISIILPVFNEAQPALSQLLGKIQECGKALKLDFEIVVVDDGSNPPIAVDSSVRLVRHPYNMGNGAAVKTGARNAKGEILVFLDSDGQHNPDDIPRLLDKLTSGYDMVVGARAADTHASLGRRFGNTFFNKLASLMTGYRVEDLTCGFRAVRADKFRKFLYLLPNGFSYPTTITMAFFRSGYPVAYIPIRSEQRQGISKIKMFKDGFRFFVIILKIGSLFSPMRLFLPISLLFFLMGTTHYAYTFVFFNRFTNMSAVLFISSLFIFLIGILSEQVSSLHYRNTDEPPEKKI